MSPIGDDLPISLIEQVSNIHISPISPKEVLSSKWRGRDIISSDQSIEQPVVKQLLSLEKELSPHKTKKTPSFLEHYSRDTLSINLSQKRITFEKTLQIVAYFGNLESLTMPRSYLPSIYSIRKCSIAKKIIGLIVKMKNLSHLDMSTWTDMSDKKTLVIDNVLKDLVPLKLRHLNIAGSLRVTRIGISHVAKNGDLTNLNLSRCNIDDFKLYEISKLTSLTHLDLSDNPLITSFGIKVLEKLTNLQYLNLSGLVGICDDALKIICDLPNITCLILRSCNITDLELHRIAKLTSITHLDIGYNIAVTDFGLIALEQLENLSHLVVRGLTGITDIGVKSILKCTSIKYLDLSDCHALKGSTFSSHETLEYLDLSDCYNFTRDSFPSLARFSKLTYLNVNGCLEFNNDSLESLQDNKNLKTLNVFETMVDCDGIESIKRAIPNLTVKNIDPENKWPEVKQILSSEKELSTKKTPSFLEHYPRDTLSINLSQQRITLEQTLQIVAYFGNLESLTMPRSNLASFCSIEKCSIANKIIGLIVKMKNLSHLDMSTWTDISDKKTLVIDNVLEGLVPLKLLHLNIAGSLRVTSIGISHVAKNGDLTNLNLSRCNIDDFKLYEISKLTSLTHLDLSDNPLITSFGIKALEKLTNLQYLNLSGLVEICDDALKIICDLPNITCLILRSCNITDLGLHRIANLTSITHLDIGYNITVTDFGLIALEQLENLSHLVVRGLTGITDIGVKSIFKCTSIKYLDLSDCHALKGSTFSSHETLEYLDLSGCYNFTSDSFSSLARFSKLTYLDVNGCLEFNNDSLESLQDNRNLKTLKTFKTMVDCDGIESIKRAIPSLTVENIDPENKWPDNPTFKSYRYIVPLFN